MSRENRIHAGDIVDALKAGLAPYVLQEYKTTYQSGQFLKELDGVLRRNNDYKKRNPRPIKHEKQAKNRIDAAGWLKAMRSNWDKVFQNELGDDRKGYVEYLLNARNLWAHQEPLTNLQTKHIAEHATLLLEAIGANEQAQITQEIMEVLAAPLYGRNTENTLKTSSSDKASQTTNNPKSQSPMSESRSDTDNGQHPQVGVAEVATLTVEEEADSPYEAEPTNNKREEPMSETQNDASEQTSHADDAIQQVLRQHQEMMRHMQRQQASHLKTTTSANADVIQLLFRQNQEMMQHMQHMQASQPAASANADVIQLLIPLIRQNQVFMQQGGVTSDDAVQQLIRQNQAFMQHVQQMQQQQQMQTSQPVININPNISPNINPSISANAGDQVTYAPPAPTTIITERNNAAFVVGVLGGLFGLLGIAHIFNHKVGRGLIYLFVGTVCYWIFLLLLLSALINIGSGLWIVAVAIHLVIIWQHAKRGAGSASANQTRESKRK